MKIIIKIFLIALLFCNANIYAQKDYKNYYKGISEFYNNNYESSINYFTVEINTDSEDYLNYLARGNAYFNNNQYNEAITDYKKAQKLKPEISNYLLAIAYAKLNNIDSSIYFLTKNLESIQKVTKSEILTNDNFDKFKTYEKWNLFLKEDNFTKIDLLFNDANYEIEKENYIEALEITNQILSKNKKNYKAIALKANIYEITKNYASAVKYYEKAVKLNSTNLETQAKLANAYYLNKDYKKSSETYNFLISKNAKELNYYLQRAKSNFELKNYELALDDIKLYTTYFYNDFEAQYLYSQILFDNEQFLESVKILNSLIEKNTTNSQYYLARGNAFLNANSYQLAINDYGIALDLAPSLTQIYFNLGLAKKGIGDMEGACNEWNKAIQNGDYKANNYIIENCKK